MNHDDRGIVTVFVAGITLALMMVAGLVIDGGNGLAARREAANVAESAARAGAQALDTGGVRTGPDAPLDVAAATGAAEAHLAASGHTGTVTVIGDLVRVEVTIEQPTYLLGLTGIGSMNVAGVGEARPVRGVIAEGT